MRVEIGYNWTNGRQKNLRKTDHLKSIYGQRSRVPETVRDVKVSDKALDQVFTPETTVYVTPQIENVTENMKAALKLPPKTTVHSKVDMEEIEVRIEESLTKARWEMRSRDIREAKEMTEEEDLEEKVNKKILFDEENNVLNFQKKKSKNQISNLSII